MTTKKKTEIEDFEEKKEGKLKRNGGKMMENLQNSRNQLVRIEN